MGDGELISSMFKRMFRISLFVSFVVDVIFHVSRQRNKETEVSEKFPNETKPVEKKKKKKRIRKVSEKKLFFFKTNYAGAKQRRTISTFPSGREREREKLR